MTGKIHYEVFFKKNRKAGWALQEAFTDRDSAIKLASGLVAKNKDGSVRVTKEKYDEATRSFRAVPVYEAGAEKYGAIDEKSSEARLPCLTPDDLSKPHARDTIRRVLTSWLERVQAVPMELLHRADLVENLEASGTELQHAVQKVAVASARENDANVQSFVKQLNELVQKALGRVYKDARDKRLPSYPKKTPFKEIASDIFSKDKRPYSLRAAMADRLSHERKFADKLEVLLDMSDALPEDAEARAFALAEVDAYIAEVISFDAGREAMMGPCKDLGETLERLACLFDGDHSADALSLAPSAAKRLAKKIKTREFEACRSVIASQLLKELERPGRLRPTSVRDEVRLARDLAARLVIVADSLLPADALIKAFTARSARLLQTDTIDEYLRHARDPNEEIERLLALEENLVGETNKGKLASYVRGVIGNARAESHYVRGEGQPLERLAVLTAHQARVMRGTYPKKDKLELAASFDTLGMKIIDESKILNMVEAGDRPALDKAMGLLRLATAGALPMGHCCGDAQARAIRHLKAAVAHSETLSDEGRAKLKGIQMLMKQLDAAKQQAA
ncbi:hypothetical protein [Maricaulis parjimensis]|uniref:hypothetical protein n=1 Tax=Maricaulis parjimensis TaxID=144023 RepID=UPI00193AB5B5|nr:hypothetical protein [Maricaulis parjimensis]